MFNLKRKAYYRLLNLQLRAELLYHSLNKSTYIKNPDFLCIGAPRTGTTWLHKALIHHPDIYLPKRKELHFFDEPIFENRNGSLHDINSNAEVLYFNINKPSHWRWYLNQFRESGSRISGELTPAYSRISDRSIQIIAEHMKDIKIIYMMRNPVERAWSGVRKFAKGRLNMNIENAPIDEILEFTMYPRRLMSGDYKAVINKWENHIHHSNILYLFYDDLVKDPLLLLNNVCDFLGVESIPESLTDKLKIRVNQAKQLDEMPIIVRDRLNDYYKGQIEFLESKFNRDFSHWKI